MTENKLKCPYCGVKDYGFPDLVFEGFNFGNQLELLEELQEKGYNIVVCDNCGQAIIQKLEV